MWNHSSIQYLRSSSFIHPLGKYSLSIYFVADTAYEWKGPGGKKGYANTLFQVTILQMKYFLWQPMTIKPSQLEEKGKQWQNMLEFQITPVEFNVLTGVHQDIGVPSHFSSGILQITKSSKGGQKKEMKSPRTKPRQRFPAAKSHHEETAGSGSLVPHLHSLPIYPLSSSVVTEITPCRPSTPRTPWHWRKMHGAKEPSALSSTKLCRNSLPI